MRKSEHIQIADEAVSLEKNIARLYKLFRYDFPGDYRFWDDLAHEEESHALLIEGAQDFLEEDCPLRNMIPSSLAEIQTANNYVQMLIEKYNTNPPSQQEALQVAAELEQSAGESHFQSAMEMPAESRMLALFQKLNGDDLNHQKRIMEYASRISR